MINLKNRAQITQISDMKKIKRIQSPKKLCIITNIQAMMILLVKAPVFLSFLWGLRGKLAKLESEND